MTKFRIQATLNQETLDIINKYFPYNRSGGIDQVIKEWVIMKKNEEWKKSSQNSRLGRSDKEYKIVETH